MENRYQAFTILINQITRSIHKLKTKEMRLLDLKSTHVSCLYYLYKNEGGLTSKELCDICNEDKALISRSLDELEKKGLVFCNASKEKRYRSPICMTEKGFELGQYIASKIDTILDEASVGLSIEQKNAMYEGLELVSKNLIKIVKEKKYD